MEDTSNVADAAALGAALAEAGHATAPAEGQSIPYVVVPQNYAVNDLEKLLAVPTRKRGVTTLRDVGSFCRFIADQKSDSTKLYGTKVGQPGFVAVFNDHAAGPGWKDHTAAYSCPLSVEWKTWTGKNKQAMNQETFAQFIEDNAPDCVTPDSATMIEIARTLEAKKKVNFASGIRLSNGQNELTYEEEITGTASKGKLPLPEVFTIGIPALEGGPKYAVFARLRYRIGEKGALSMWFDLERPHKVLEDAVNEVWEQIEATTSLSIFNGA